MSFIKNGEYKYWYENGQLQEHAFYRDGKLEGEYKYWYENGQPRMQAFYRDGKLEGELRAWYENGWPCEREFYRDGELIDIFFTTEKKLQFLKIQRYFRSRIIRENYTLISDLAKILFSRN